MTPTELPGLDDARGAPEAVTIGLPGLGEITANVLRSAALSLGQPNDCYLGYDSSSDRKVMVESPATFEWDGEFGHGWLERTATLS